MPDVERGPASILTLRRLPVGYRVLYSGVLALILLGHGAGLLQQSLRSGLTPRGAAEWILGNEDDPAATRFLFPRDGAEVLDEVWRRSLADVVPTIVLLALLFRSSAPPAVRSGLGAALLVAALADEAGPGLVAVLGPAWGTVWWAAQLLLAAAAGAVAVVCAAEMWLLRGRGRRFRAHGEGGLP